MLKVRVPIPGDIISSGSAFYTVLDDGLTIKYLFKFDPNVDYESFELFGDNLDRKRNLKMFRPEPMLVYTEDMIRHLKSES